jgi:hypothetical protein
VTKNTVAITVNNKEVLVDRSKDLTYEGLCKLANVDPKLVPSIIYLAGPLLCGAAYPGEVVPIKRGAAYDVRVDPTA